jgi:hypothetical protein
MSGPCRRKADQLPRAGFAVHAIDASGAQPKRTTSFTDFQFQAQVIHFVVSKAYLSPASLRDFSGVGGARSGRYEVLEAIPEALRGFSGMGLHLFFCRSVSLRLRPGEVEPAPFHSLPIREILALYCSVSQIVF